jgi:hypothetical protein
VVLRVARFFQVARFFSFSGAKLPGFCGFQVFRLPGFCGFQVFRLPSESFGVCQVKVVGCLGAPRGCTKQVHQAGSPSGLSGKEAQQQEAKRLSQERISAADLDIGEGP